MMKPDIQSDYGDLFSVHDPLANRPLRLEPFDDDWLDHKEAWATATMLNQFVYYYSDIE